MQTWTLIIVTIFVAFALVGIGIAADVTGNRAMRMYVPVVKDNQIVQMALPEDVCVVNGGPVILSYRFEGPDATKANSVYTLLLQDGTQVMETWFNGVKGPRILLAGSPKRTCE